MVCDRALLRTDTDPFSPENGWASVRDAIAAARIARHALRSQPPQSPASAVPTLHSLKPQCLFPTIPLLRTDADPFSPENGWASVRDATAAARTLSQASHVSAPLSVAGHIFCFFSSHFLFLPFPCRTPTPTWTNWGGTPSGVAGNIMLLLMSLPLSSSMLTFASKVERLTRLDAPDANLTGHDHDCPDQGLQRTP